MGQLHQQRQGMTQPFFPVLCLASGVPSFRCDALHITAGGYEAWIVPLVIDLNLGPLGPHGVPPADRIENKHFPVPGRVSRVAVGRPICVSRRADGDPAAACSEAWT